MSYDEFIKKWNGKFLDVDLKFGAQCTDLMRGYIRDVFGLPPYDLPAVSYARQIYQNYQTYKNFTKIPNTPTGVPKKGDIIFWGIYPGVTGIAGHVAIFDSGDMNNFISFDQNWGPTGSPCSFRKHSYRGVIGWLHKK